MKLCRGPIRRSTTRHIEMSRSLALAESTKNPVTEIPTTVKKTKSAQPPIGVMVFRALIALFDERSGVSLRAVKDFISGNSDIDVSSTRNAKRIKLQIKAAFESGELVQVRVGCAGSFKLYVPNRNEKTANKTKVIGSPLSKETKKVTKKTTVKSKAKVKASKHKMIALKKLSQKTQSRLVRTLLRHGNQ